MFFVRLNNDHFATSTKIIAHVHGAGTYGTYINTCGPFTHYCIITKHWLCWSVLIKKSSMNPDLDISCKIAVKLARCKEVTTILMAATVQQQILDVQEDQLFRYRAEIACAVIWLAVASDCVSACACNRPCAQILVGVATLRKCISFIRQIRPFG